MVWSVETGADVAPQQTSMLNRVVATTMPVQQTTMLNWANLSDRAQKVKGLNFCASQFVTEDEVTKLSCSVSASKTRALLQVYLFSVEGFPCKINA